MPQSATHGGLVCLRKRHSGQEFDACQLFGNSHFFYVTLIFCSKNVFVACFSGFSRVHIAHHFDRSRSSSAYRMWCVLRSCKEDCSPESAVSCSHFHTLGLSSHRIRMVILPNICPLLLSNGTSSS